MKLIAAGIAAAIVGMVLASGCVSNARYGMYVDEYSETAALAIELGQSPDPVKGFVPWAFGSGEGLLSIAADAAIAAGTVWGASALVDEINDDGGGDGITINVQDSAHAAIAIGPSDARQETYGSSRANASSTSSE